MKKITLLLFLFTVSFSFGQVVLTEDFEAGVTLPADWTNNDILSNGDTWTIESGGEAALLAAGNANVYTSGGAVGNYATFDSDGNSDNGLPEEVALESPVFNAAALTQVTLEYNHYFAGNYGGNAFVEVSTNGTSWTTVATYTGDGYRGGRVSLDVTAELGGQASAQVRFRWTGNYAVAWYVDNVTVFQCTVNAPDAVTAAVSPANGATDVEISYGDPNNIGPFEWTVPATGDAADSYNINLGTNLAGDDIGTISGFPNGNSINFGWEPNTTYYWSIEAVNCAGTTVGTVFSFTTAACTEISAPLAASAPTPVDGATNVLIGSSDFGLDFSWTAGNANDNFILNLGIANPPTQSFNDFESGERITGLEENTTYYWSVDAVNCFGTTAGPVWSFTTGAALSIEDETVNLFSVYPNPVKSQVSIKTALTIDTVELYNQMGQRVLSIDGSSLLNNTINLLSLDSGLYFMNISAEGKKQTLKIIKE